MTVSLVNSALGSPGAKPRKQLALRTGLLIEVAGLVGFQPTASRLVADPSMR